MGRTSTPPNGADVTTIQIDGNGEPVGDDGAKGENWEYDSNLTLKKGTYTFSAPGHLRRYYQWCNSGWRYV